MRVGWLHEEFRNRGKAFAASVIRLCVELIRIMREFEFVVGKCYAMERLWQLIFVKHHRHDLTPNLSQRLELVYKKQMRHFCD